MSSPRIDPRDVIGGAFLVAFGAAAIVIATHYPFGDARRMGPGYFPVVLGWICVGLGGCIIGKGCIPKLWDAGVPQLPSMRAVLGITASIALFVAVGGYFGLVPGILALVIAAGLVDRGNSLRTVMALAVGVTICGVALFHYGLGITFPLFGQ